MVWLCYCITYIPHWCFSYTVANYVTEKWSGYHLTSLTSGIIPFWVMCYVQTCVINNVNTTYSEVHTSILQTTVSLVIYLFSPFSHSGSIPLHVWSFKQTRMIKGLELLANVYPESQKIMISSSWTYWLLTGSTLTFSFFMAFSISQVAILSNNHNFKVAQHYWCSIMFTLTGGSSSWPLTIWHTCTFSWTK